jgi:hypothetical protein
VHPTPYPELNGLLAEIVGHARGVFGDDLVGAYLVGSFAVGDADLQSDCDFLVVVRYPIDPERERAVRSLWDEVPLRDGFWTGHLEGSYADVAALGDLDRIGEPWLFVDHGHREMEWSEHCNREVVRWSLAERGVPLAGPPPSAFVAPVPAAMVSERMRRDLPTLTEDILDWANPGHSWTQRYLVTTYCRVLYSLVTGEVTSKRKALEWGMGEFDARWRTLLEQVRDDRDTDIPWIDPPRPGSYEAALEFAASCRD